MPDRLAIARLVLLAAVAGASLAGCGGDDTSAPPVASTSASATTAPSADPSSTASTAEPSVSTSIPAGETPSTADLPGPGRALFRCATTNGKRIELTEHGSIIRYSFGPAGEPEIVLDVDRALATTYQWQGVGRNEAYSVDVPNPTATDGDYVYSVFWNYDKLVEGPDALTAGVVVYIDGDPGVTIECADPEEAIMNLIGVELAPTG